jgi:hypothetical protein
VACGSGPDFAIVDRRDDVARHGKNRCEQIDDGSQKKPRPGQIHVEPQPCEEPGQSPGGLRGPKRYVALGLPTRERPVPLRDSIMLASGYQRRPAPTLDVARCSVHLTAPSGQRRSASAVISGAAVEVGQTAGRSVTTKLTVKAPRCAAGAERVGAAAPRLRVHTAKRPGRRGRWRVRGNYSIGGSVGTDWTTIEACSSTTTVVHQGRVRVFDRIKGSTEIVRAGEKYVAGPASSALRSARPQRRVESHLGIRPWPRPRLPSLFLAANPALAP